MKLEKEILEQKIRNIVTKRLKDISNDVGNLLLVYCDDRLINIIDSVYGEPITRVYSSLIPYKQEEKLKSCKNCKFNETDNLCLYGNLCEKLNKWEGIE